MWLGVLFASLLLPACSGEKAKPKAPAVPVTVAEAVQKTVPVQFKAIGNVDAYSTVEIKTRQGGEITRLGFKEGDDVKVGDLLFVIDPRPYEVALKEAQARLARDKALAVKADNDVRRYADLIRKDFVSREQYDQAIANADSLKATVQADEVAVENARLQLRYCYIYAPITGRTGSLLAHQGNVIKANADTAMLVINQVQPINVNFAVPEQQLAEVHKYLAQGRLPVEAVISKEDQRPEVGELTFVDNTVDKATGTIKLKGTFANRDKRLWPGQFVNVVLKLSTRPNAVVVPSQAVQAGQEGPFVFVVKPDLTVEYRRVVVGRPLNGEAVIDQGVQAGERVVTDGHLRLVPGSKVQVKNPEGDSAKNP